MGADRGADVELYGSASKYLELNNLGVKRFDFQSMDTVSNMYTYNTYKNILSHYSGYKNESISNPVKGDLLIEIPFRESNLDIKMDNISSLSNLTLIYESDVQISHSYTLNVFALFQLIRGKKTGLISQNKPWKIYRVQ